MELGLLEQYIVLVVLVACLIVGYILKHASIFKWIPNNDIPVILAIVGAILNAVNSGISLESIVSGAISGLASVGVHQAFKEWVGKYNSVE